MDRLEDVLRADESSDDLVLLLRGGEDTSAKLLRQAALFERRYTYGGQRARGISLFGASSAVDELAVLESKLRTYPKYRRVGRAELAEVAVLLPTFQAPHWTVGLREGVNGRWRTAPARHKASSAGLARRDGGG